MTLVWFLRYQRKMPIDISIFLGNLDVCSPFLFKSMQKIHTLIFIQKKNPFPNHIALDLQFFLISNVRSLDVLMINWGCVTTDGLSLLCFNCVIFACRSSFNMFFFLFNVVPTELCQWKLIWRKMEAWLSVGTGKVQYRRHSRVY